jgi:hypothetical protein
MTPPSTGPRIGPTSIGRLTVAVTRPNDGVLPPPAARAVRIARVCISGKIRPAPAPCTTRKAIRLSAFQAAANSAEPVTNRVSAAIQSRLPPNRACPQPTSGITTPRASR